MPQTDIGNAVASDIASNTTDYAINSRTTDAGNGDPETSWSNTDYPKWFGYYKEIPELAAAIDAKATWTVGKGVKSSAGFKTIIENIRGWGKDTFNTILENMIRVYNIGGDAFCEVIRDEDGDVLNLKPLDPSVITIVVDDKGIIKRYEQQSKVKGKAPKSFTPDKIFHLARNRVSDEIHGVSIIERLENIILMRNEAMSDWKRVMHRNVDPMMIYHLDTDDPTKIASFKAKVDAAKGKGENMYIPKDAVVPELLSMAPNASLNPLPWIEQLNNYFFQATGVPQIIVGGSAEFTEATAKIAYLAFQQTIEEEQLFIEEEALQQLQIVIELDFPASLENELLSDTKKDKETGATKPSDTTAGEGQ